jgi:transcriptional regulator with XRE-family HTH domain
MLLQAGHAVDYPEVMERGFRVGGMATASTKHVGQALRKWRMRRRLSQLELALDAGVSARHLSFVETGRSHPGRDMLLRIAEQLEIPFRERNQLLLSAGHAPAFAERALDHPELASVRAAIHSILKRHEPYPGIAVDRHWNLVAANSSVVALAESLEIDPALAEPPVNALRVTFHPNGLAPLIVNLGDWRAVFLERIARQVATTGDEELASLMEELSSYPAPPSDGAMTDVAGPVKIRAPDGAELSFFGMFAGFEAPFEVTTSELAVELLFPADAATADAMKRPES